MTFPYNQVSNKLMRPLIAHLTGIQSLTTKNDDEFFDLNYLQNKWFI